MLHLWLKTELAAVLAGRPEPTEQVSAEEHRPRWERWQEGLTVRITLPETLPPLRMLLVLDNLTGHDPGDFVRWLFAHGIMPLYTPLGGRWLNMAESIQRILKRRALAGHHPQTPEDIIAWLEAAAQGWTRERTPFVWGSKRRARRERDSDDIESVDQGPSPANRSPALYPNGNPQWQSSTHLTH